MTRTLAKLILVVDAMIVFGLLGLTDINAAISLALGLFIGLSIILALCKLTN